MSQTLTNLVSAAFLIATIAVAPVARAGPATMDPALAQTGTWFAAYGITLSSADAVRLSWFGSDDHVVTVVLGPASVGGAAWTTITVSGLLPLTTYYLYQDRYEAPMEVSSTLAGSVEFLQGLDGSHLVILQDTHATVTVGAASCPVGWACAPAGGPYETAIAPTGCSITESVQVVSPAIDVDLNGCTLTPGASSHAIIVDADDVTIRNGVVVGGASCVLVNSHSSIVIDTMTCSGGTPSGCIVLNNNLGSTVQNSTTSGCTPNGIGVGNGGENLRILDNVAMGNRFGINVGGATNVRIARNIVTGSTRFGGLIQFSEFLVLEDNVFGQTAPVAGDPPEDTAGLLAVGSSYLLSLHDRVEGNAGPGLIVAGTGDTVFAGLAATGNGGDGVAVTGTYGSGTSQEVYFQGTATISTQIHGNARGGLSFGPMTSGTVGPDVDATGNNTAGGAYVDIDIDSGATVTRTGSVICGTSNNFQCGSAEQTLPDLGDDPLLTIREMVRGGNPADMPVLREAVASKHAALVRERALFALVKIGMRAGQAAALEDELRELLFGAPPEDNIVGAALANLDIVRQRLPRPEMGDLDIHIDGAVHQGSQARLRVDVTSSTGAPKAAVAITKASRVDPPLQPPGGIELLSTRRQVKFPIPQAGVTHHVGFDLAFHDVGLYELRVRFKQSYTIYDDAIVERSIACRVGVESGSCRLVRLLRGDGDGDRVPDLLDLCPSSGPGSYIERHGCAASELADGATTDVDGDGVAQFYDNCPEVSNALQGNVDRDGAGDLCDLCPADSADQCAPDLTTAEECPPSGCVLETGDGTVTVDIPPGALETPSTVSSTGGGTFTSIVTDQGPGTAVLKVFLAGPSAFDEPVAVNLRWIDADGDGNVDGSNLPEGSLVVTRDQKVLTDPCASGGSCASSRCVSASCDLAANTFTVRTLEFSEYALVVLGNRPPDAVCAAVTVPAGGDVCVAHASIDAGSSDPDGDDLTVGQQPPGPYALGTTAVEVVVSDGAASSSCSASVTVVDATPPSVEVGGQVAAECAGPNGTAVEVPAAQVWDSCDPAPTVTTLGALETYPLGTTQLTITATDAAGNSASDVLEVSIVDSLPPVVTTSETVLWPPDHKYAEISLANCVAAVDQCGGELDVSQAASIVSVTSDEADSGVGSGATEDDIVMVDARTVLLRRERRGGGDGRVYNVDFVVVDASGNATPGTCRVSVPHDKAKPAVDDRPAK